MIDRPAAGGDEGRRVTALAVAYRELMRAESGPPCPDRISAAYAEAWEGVSKLARRMANKIYRDCPGCDRDDLVSVAAANLPNIVKSYEPEYGVLFNTYFTRSVHSLMIMAYQKMRNAVRVPAHVYSGISRAVRNRPGKPIRPDLMAAGEAAMRCFNHPDNALEEILHRDESDDGSEVREEVSARLARLRPEHRTIIRLRFGLGEGEGMTLREVGEAMSRSEHGRGRRFTSEWVRKLQEKALRAMRD